MWQLEALKTLVAEVIKDAVYIAVFAIGFALAWFWKDHEIAKLVEAAQKNTIVAQQKQTKAATVSATQEQKINDASVKIVYKLAQTKITATCTAISDDDYRLFNQLISTANGSQLGPEVPASTDADQPAVADYESSNR